MKSAERVIWESRAPRKSAKVVLGSRDSLNPPYKSGDEHNRGEIVARQSIERVAIRMKSLSLLKALSMRREVCTDAC